MRAITPFKSFKITDVGANRKPVCDFLIFHALWSLPVIVYLMRQAVREWEREEMGITNGNGRGMEIKRG